MRILISVCLFLALALQATAQSYSTLGRDPAFVGGLSESQARSKGWTTFFRLQRDTVTEMRGGREGGNNYWVTARLRAGEPCVVDDQGVVRLMACGNPTRIPPPSITRIEKQETVVVREVIRTEYVPVTVYAPQNYIVSPTPQPVLNYVARPPIYLNLGLPIDSGGQGNNINIFGSSATTGPTKNINANGNWNSNTNRNTATGGAVGDIFNLNNNAATAGATNNNANTGVTNTGPGNAGGNAQTGR